jgi:cytochrome c peroxidase
VAKRAPPKECTLVGLLSNPKSGYALFNAKFNATGCHQSEFVQNSFLKSPRDKIKQNKNKNKPILMKIIK